nr:glutamate racemase [Maliibacterium massiliense]
MNDSKRPIGIYDSGLGGVAVLADAMRAFPKERFIFLGDFANAPYGEKPLEEIRRLVLASVRQLMTHHIKALLVACNTATAAAVHLLRAQLAIPVVGMEPAVRPASGVAHGAPVAVLATPATLQLKKFQKLVQDIGSTVHVLPVPCPGLAGLIDAEADAVALRACIMANLPPEAQRAGAVVLGCTHYLHIRSIVASCFRQGVPVIDGNEGTLRQLARVLAQNDLLWEGPPIPPRLLLTTTGDAARDVPHMRRALTRLQGE